MDKARIKSIVMFLNEAEKLKDTLRSGRTSGGRPESTAEHSWRLALLAMIVSADMADVDQLKLIKICLVHDLGEALSGDVPAPDQASDPDRRAREQRDLSALCAMLPDELSKEIVDLCKEYDEAQTGEAKLAKGFDKIETILQHAIGSNPKDFDLAFNLDYGRAQTNTLPVLGELRQIADELTNSRLENPEKQNDEQ